MSGWHVAVLIPARNEERLLPACLRSVAAARAALPADVSTDVVLVSDCSTDRTAAIARQMLGGHGAVVEAKAGCVGVARSVAAQVALQRHGGPMHRTWLANTDADCEVPETWLLDQVRMAQAGYAAVAGVVDVTDFSEHLPMVQERFRATYRIETDWTHPHVHGANLGMRADAYLLAGGWGTLETAEDHDLWGRSRACGGLHVSDARLQVVTSGRRVGRAPMGFAGALAAHNRTVDVEVAA